MVHLLDIHLRPFRKHEALAFLFLTLVLVTGTTSANAEPRLLPAIEEPARFDIPSQSLEDALMAYASATGVEVFFDHALAAGQRSSQLQGAYTSEAALQQLLAGTGLELRRAAHRAYTLVAPPVQEPPVGGTPAWPADSERGQFFAALQLAIKRTLCARPETSPGQYRAALAVWIGPAGNVVSARVLIANGQEGIARGLVEGIQRISVGQPPPAGLEQPVTFVILPRSASRTGDCLSRNIGRE